jgi:hypothetical protein
MQLMAQPRGFARAQVATQHRQADAAIG